MDGIIQIGKSNPQEKANIFSKIFFGWMAKICYVAVKRSLKVTDLYRCLTVDRSERLTDKIELKWKEELEKAKTKSKEPSLTSSIVKVFGPTYMFYGLFVFLTSGILRSVQPMILGMFIRQFSTLSEGTLNDKLILGGILLAMSTITVLTYHQLNLLLSQIGMRVRVACSSLIYRKLLRLSTKSLNEAAAGKVVNLLSNDVNRFDLVVILLHFFWIMPIQVVLLTYLIWREVGVSAFIGVAVMLILTLPLQGAIAKLASMFRIKVAHKSDSRIKLMGQLIAGIQVVKMYVWEEALADTVKKIRASEISTLRKTSYLRGILSAMSVFMERFVTFITVVSYVLLGNTITADVVFALASFYNILQMTTAIYYPLALLFLSETKVSIKRLQEFLLLEEKEKSKIVLTNDGKVSLKSVEVFWNPKVASLIDITINVPQGSLCAVVGPVGSGKSTLLQLLLGEIALYNGLVEVGGTISYSSQEAWIFASTVRRNIVFAQEYDKTRYEQVVEVCALKADFQQFPYKDKTIVGEKGISLSGGQRARINLARTVYRDADIYLLDDPLSAVDAHVGKHLFEKCILQFLKHKTRILVTHQLQYLKKADQIVVLDNSGRIEACGTFDELSKSTLDFTKLLSSAEEDIEEVKHVEQSTGRPSVLSITSENWEEEQLEKNAETIVTKGKSPYGQYAKYASNICGLLFLFISLVISQTATSGCDYWTSYWTQLEEERSALNSTSIEGSSSNMLSTEWCMIIYTILVIACLLLATNRSLLFYKLGMNASTHLHGNMFSALLRAPMRFFDVNPMGRILNRFTKDIGIIDELLPRLMLDASSILLIMLGIFVNVAISNVWMITAAVVLGVIFIVILKFYITIARDVKHLEGITKSPVFSHLSATLNGLVTVRSTKSEPILAFEFDQHQDTHSSAWYLTISCMSSFGLWLDIVSLLFIYCVTIAFIFMSEEGYITGSAVGLAVQQSLILIGMLSFGMRQMAEMVSNMAAVERIVEYTTLEKEENPNEKKSMPNIEWPSKGAIVFKNLYLKYSNEDPPVLRDLNFTIEAGEKIGIVGRTGAGKTSLIGALFRLAKLEGNIFIDGVDTQSVPLSELRKRISIIPQEPVLFSETLRYNLDPFNEFDDKNIWNALDVVELKGSIQSLDMTVQEGGSNFSVGQRQLLCLARAILRNNKILVLDEATANVDPQTDSLIQITIRKRFKDCTVMTIAHRLNTVMDSDKILVMDSGSMVEYDHPYKLLQNKEGILYKLVSQTGPSMEAQLYNVAKDSYSRKYDNNDVSSRL
ncbi:multidrug resistance-associated protein 4-like [Agrilus planipennis]|uniref:Multidrug resistance-associated protein 4-like n=1 Tax=Agrilus planipennis TaxID=224129 RepID=A0A1W4WP56_AGRPL|nr:multidrug resistance-associated protein 4-like [Agrilus planipennis]